jgi:tetratricopeptide (TPR) repeat protein
MLWNAQELGKPEIGEVAVIKLTFADKDVAVAGLNVLERFYTDGRVRKPESVPPLIRKVLALELPADQKCPLQARLINALRVAGQIEDGLKELAALKQEFGSQDKTKPAVQLAEADFYRSLGRLERAAKVYEQYLKDSGPGFDPGVLRLLAEILLNLGEERRAFEVLKQAWGIPNFRDHGWVVERLADLSLELADYETCKKAMAEILAWQGNERQKAERQARATASSRLEEIHAAAKALPDKTEGGTLLNLDFAGQSELPLPLSSAALSQATLQKDKDGVEAVVPAGKDMAVADFRFNLAKPKQGQVKLRCKVVPEFAGRQPDEFQAVF